MSEPNSGLGRRGERAYAESRRVMVKPSIGQSRHQRRLNLREGRIANRPPAVAERKEAERRAAVRRAHAEAEGSPGRVTAVTVDRAAE